MAFFPIFLRPPASPKISSRLKKRKKTSEKFVGSKKSITFATAFREMRLVFKVDAVIAQLVEHDLAKVGVASSSLVYRSVSCINAKENHSHKPRWRNW